MAVAIWIVLVSGLALGVAAAIAALYGRYGVLPAWLTGPNICKLEAGGCQVLFRTRYAALLGPPNAALGLLLYAALAAGLVVGVPTWPLVLAASAALGMSVYLAWVLITQQLECRICWAGHVANAAIWLALIARALSSEAQI